MAQSQVLLKQVPTQFKFQVEKAGLCCFSILYKHAARWTSKYIDAGNLRDRIILILTDYRQERYCASLLGAEEFDFGKLLLIAGVA